MPIITNRGIKYNEGSYGGREQLLTLDTIKLSSQHKELAPTSVCNKICGQQHPEDNKTQNISDKAGHVIRKKCCTDPL